MVKRSALLVAGGRGQRFGAPIPKQYVRMGGHVLLWHTLNSLGSCPEIDEICVVIGTDDKVSFEDAIDKLPSFILSKIISPVEGGAERQSSVKNGLEYLNTLPVRPDFVFIHDAARPFVSREMVTQLCNSLEFAGGVVPAIPISDTIKKVSEDPVIFKNKKFEKISSTQDRQGLYRVQTPQAFRFKEILLAHRNIIEGNMTDDASIMEAQGNKVIIIDGDPKNLKITTQKDIELAKQYLNFQNEKNMELGMSLIEHEPKDHRVGMGFDVHRFGTGSGLMICGVHVPFDKGVLAHSDGDVGLHALVDAILGALGEDDIGKHFPPDEEQWADMPSEIFLKRAFKLVRKNGGRLINADITIIAERPKIQFYRESMKSKISSITGYPQTCFNIKATTTEKVGFIGRCEGIAAQAIVSLELPKTNQKI